MNRMESRIEYGQRKDISSLMFLELNFLVVKCRFFFFFAHLGPVLSSVLLSHGEHSSVNLMSNTVR